MGIGVKEWIGDAPLEPPGPSTARPSRCPACGAASAPVGETLNLHAHSKHRLRQFTELTGLPDSLEDLGERSADLLEERRLPIRRYLCLVCETTCTVVPDEIRTGADLTGPMVVFALAVWVGHPEGPSAGQIRRWLYPGRRFGGPGWPQLHRWAGAEELLGPGEQLDEGLPPKERAARLVQMAMARAPPGMRDEPPFRRAVQAVKNAH